MRSTGVAHSKVIQTMMHILQPLISKGNIRTFTILYGVQGQIGVKRMGIENNGTALYIKSNFIYGDRSIIEAAKISYFKMRQT